MFLFCSLNLFISNSLRKHSLHFQTTLELHVVEINYYKIPFQESSDGFEEKQTQDKGRKLNKDVNINHSTAQRQISVQRHNFSAGINQQRPVRAVLIYVSSGSSFMLLLKQETRCLFKFAHITKGRILKNQRTIKHQFPFILKDNSVSNPCNWLGEISL